MNNKNKKSKIWSVLFYLCFAAVIISTAVLVKYYKGYQAANNRYEGMQAGINAETEDNIESVRSVEDTGIVGEAGSVGNAELVYIKENIQETLEENGVSAETEEILNANIADTVNAANIAGIGNTANAAHTNIAAGEVQKADMQNAIAEDIKIPQKSLDWNALHEQNADIYAWIYVPDTKVDYPILQHPTDNSYYLNYNIDGTKGFPGCIYTENYNKKDFSDVHTVIYGHNLKDKTMFTSLHNFEDDELFSKEHYIYIYTQDYVYVYRIFAAYEFSAIHLLDNYDFTNEYVYEDFLKKIYNTTDRVANVKQDIKVTAKDKIVTLSTCTKDSDSSKRFLVTGVLINPKE